MLLKEIAFDLSPTPLVILSYRNVIELNDSFQELFGFSRAELIGNTTQRLFPSKADYESIGHSALKNLLDSNRHTYSDRRFMRHKNGISFWTETHGRTLTPEDPLKLMIWHIQKKDENQFKDQQNLTRREYEIAQYIVNGLTCKEIGKKLKLSHRTIEAHKANLMKKLNINKKQDLSSKIIITQP